MNRQQRRAEKRAGHHADPAVLDMAARIAELDDEGRATARAARAARLASLPMTPAERGEAARLARIMDALVASMVTAKRGAR